MEKFLGEMQNLLKDKYELFLSTINDSPYKGIRINNLVVENEKEVLDNLSFVKDKTPFASNGYYIDIDEEKIGNNIYHQVGAIYSQEPSAMSAVTLLDVQKNDIVLDLCAAPGSKTTQIAEKLCNTGLLWSNEIVKNRAQILISNIERMGIKNAIVSNCEPDVLCNSLNSFFDKVLVDAPCSGEGMFRKDKSAIKEWSIEHVKACAVRQLKILESAKLALKDGGTLVYSTCTFSYEENEGVIEKFLLLNPGFELVSKKRIYPFDKGEGHFAAKLIKKGNLEKTNLYSEEIKNEAVNVFLDDILKNNNFKNIEIVKDNIYSMPFSKSSLPDFKNLGVLRAGVKIGEIKNKRIEPHHHLFRVVKKEDVKRCVNLSENDERLIKFLHGEEIDINEDFKGYTLVSFNNMSLGFGKASNYKLKNKYPKGMRINNG